jgi:diguanylate cyclase (GGDEF)-like protein
MIDVDHFKLINDSHGHPAGDEVLCLVAGRLAERLRVQDSLGRYGGEEFCAALPDTDMEGALLLAESLRMSIATMPFDTEKGRLSITVSIGISICPENARRALKDVLNEADSALYTAKQTGRNKVVCYGCAGNEMAGTVNPV